MTKADSVRGEQPFDMAGEGVTLQFLNSDLRKLQHEVQAAADDDEKNAWVQRVIGLAALSDMGMLELLLKYGAKKDGKHHEVDLDSIDKPVAEIFEFIVDGFSLAMFGRTFKEQQDWVAGQLDTGDDGPQTDAP